MRVWMGWTASWMLTTFGWGADVQVGPAELRPRPVERVGPPTLYAQPMQRYHELHRTRPDRHYPIPQQTITRDTYYKWLEDSGHIRYAEDADKHGPYGPRHLTPVLAAYVKTGQRSYGEACLTMLKAFDRYLHEEVARSGWHSLFIGEPGLIGLYRRYLLRGGLLDEKKDVWFREMVLYMNRHVHVWGTPETFWRGPMHRAQGEGVMKGLAARWYPDAPEAATWKRYAEAVYQDFWTYRDNPPNDTGYYFGIMLPLVLRAELVDDTAFFTDAAMKAVWERMMYEVSPDGAIIPYGAHGGWNSTAGMRVFMLELIAARTKDGRFRYAAHKLMNYLLYQQEAYKDHHMLIGPETTEQIALAYLLADDAVQPVPPEAGSKILYRKETLRLRDKAAAKRWLKDLDPAPDKAHICCSLIVTDKPLPAKLVLRSGWGPGDLFALVDLFPRHDPLNVPGVLGLMRHGTVLTMTVPAKGFSDENRLLIEDLSGTAPLRWNQDPDLADPYYQDVTVPVFQDLKRATFAAVTVKDYQGFPVRLVREFAFLKNRFLVVRDVPEFEEGFLALVGPVFNTENVGPQVGDHWANTFIVAPKFLNYPVKNPAWDLLVYFAPRPDCQMQVVDRTATDPRTSYVPAQLRYRWRGVTRRGQKLVFTQVFYPHEPTTMKPASTAAGLDRTADLMGTAGADGIAVLLDTPEATVLRFRFEPDRVEWVVFNTAGGKVEAAGLATDARFAYVDLVKDAVAGAACSDGTWLAIGGKDVFRQADRRPWEK